MTSAEEYVDRLRNEYIENQKREQERDELIAENNREKAEIIGYHGREIFELLQNADDAYQKSINEGQKPDQPLNVVIEYKNNILTISNTGTFFDRDGIKAIVQGNNSPKEGKYIGNKGTGFRSILNWADKINIFSGDFHIEFSKDYAYKVFDDLEKEPQIKKQLEKHPDLYLPILALPYNTHDYNKDDKTTIKIVINPDKIKDDFSVQKQLDDINLRILLFLPNICQITINTEGKNVTYQKERKNNLNEYTLQKTINGECQTKETFITYSKSIEKFPTEETDKNKRILTKDVFLSIAVPVNFSNFKSDYLYSYFPLLNTDSPFNCVLHATYILNSDRNTVVQNSTNKKILQEQINFLIETAQTFIARKKFDTAYQILSFKENNNLLLKFDLENKYIEELYKLKMFPTLSGNIISIADGLLILKKYSAHDVDITDIFKGYAFAKILKPTICEQGAKLIGTICKRKNINFECDENTLFDAINQSTMQWSISQRVRTFIWWNALKYKSLPNLLKNQNGEWLEHASECYFLDGNFDSSILPNWCKTPALDKEYQNELLKQAGEITEIVEEKEKSKYEKKQSTPTSRIISQNKDIFPTVNFSYVDRSTIIPAINSSVDNYEKAVEFVNWLWTNHGYDNNWSPPGTAHDSKKINYKFPNIDKRIQNSEELYFGTDYDNFMAERLFCKPYSAFSPSKSFKLNKEDTENFKNFIKKFGVKEYPTIVSHNFDREDIYPTFGNFYVNSIKEKGKSDVKFIFYSKISCIPQLKDILSNLTTYEIIQWIDTDTKLRSHLNNPCESSDAVITYRNNREYYDHMWNEPIKNYILEIFNNEKWIELHGERFSPKDILLALNPSVNKDYGGIVPLITEQNIKEISQRTNVSVYNIRDILYCFAFKNKITDLDSEKFYELLLKLPEIEPTKSISISKSIYNIIEQPNFSKNYEDCISKREFFKTGKMLVKYHGIYEYCPAKNAYLPSSTIINKNNLPIVVKGNRTNNDHFVTIFGCKKYEKKYKIVDNNIEESPANREFQTYFREFKKYLKPFEDLNTNLRDQAQKVSITLVSKIILSENDEIYTVEEDYYYINISNTKWYIKISDENYDVYKISPIIEEIYKNLANTPGFEVAKIGELFRNSDENRRKFLLEECFGFGHVQIKNEDESIFIRKNFYDTVKKIYPSYNTEKIDIDFDNFFDISNSAKIIRLFKEIGTDTISFRNTGFEYQIDLCDYNKQRWQNYIHNNLEKYKTWLYCDLLKKTAAEQEKFYDTVDDFYYQESKKCENFNSCNFEPEKEFPVPEPEQPDISTDKIWKQQYEKLKNICININIDEELRNNNRIKSLLLFGNLESIKQYFDKRQNETIKIDETESETDLSAENIKIEELQYTKVIKNSHRSSHQKSSQHSQKTDERKQKSGIKAELLVYNRLLNDKSNKYNDIKWLSGNAEKAKFINSAQGNDNLGYDMTYTDENGNIQYVEVKKATQESNNVYSFIISQNEENFALKNINNYSVFLVINDTIKYIRGSNLKDYLASGEIHSKICKINLSDV